jgi:hypothetical protein
MAPLTFGVEIEFALATLPEWARDPEPHDTRQVYDISDENAVKLALLNDDRTLHKITRAHIRKRLEYEIVQRHLAETLISAAFPATTDENNRRLCNTAAKDGKEYIFPYDSWHVSTDKSISVPGELRTAGITDYEWYKIELISPVLVFSPDAIQQVNKVCKLIQRKYCTPTNKSCGLHIHVGRGSDGLPDYVIKSLMATIWTFEDRIDLLHPLHRTNAKPCNSLYNSAPLALKVDLETGNSSNLRQQLDMILDCENRDKVIDLVNDQFPCYGFAYKVWSLRSHFDWLSKRTIEFRQHEGTLNTRQIESWIRVCVGLVEFSRKTHPGYLISFLRSVVDNEEYTIEDLLLDIGLSRQAKFYGRLLGKMS